MPRYVAFLRAINVGGHAIIKMADLRDMLASFGLEDVQTHIQTGNIVFESPKRSPQGVQGELEKRLAAEGLETQVFVQTPEQLAKIAKANPFRPADDSVQSHVMFLDGRPAAASIKRLMGMEGQEYRFCVEGDVLYYAYDKKWAGKRRNIDFERVLGVRGTARTWRVVDKLVDMARVQGGG